MKLKKEGRQVIENIFDFLKEIGVAGLFIVMIIEGISVPIFPGTLFVLGFGYLLQPDLKTILLRALEMSILYTLSSYIPFYIGIQFQDKLTKRFKRKIHQTQKWFNKYGEGSIFLTRLIGIGYIAYVSGMSKVNKVKYGLLTFLGNFVWSLVFLTLGQIYKGDVHTLIMTISKYQKYIYLALGAIVFIFFLMISRKRHAGKN
jgi:membrane protein DedA with SNARE-associated domain